MKVHELIKALGKYDANADVMVTVGNEFSDYYATESFQIVANTKDYTLEIEAKLPGNLYLATESSYDY